MFKAPFTGIDMSTEISCGGISEDWRQDDIDWVCRYATGWAERKMDTDARMHVGESERLKRLLSQGRGWVFGSMRSSGGECW